jgi:hypothetical protein
MDKRVYYFFTFVFIAAAGSFSFRYTNYEPCVDVDFAFDQLEPKAGSAIQFRANSEGAKEWEWDFGDDTGIANQKNELHVFEEPGFYEVTLKINNRCELTKPIYVEANTKVLDSTKFPEFSLPKSIKVGEILVVTDQSKRGRSWEWRFGETAKANATTKTAQHFYGRPGVYTVSLLINDEIDYLVKKTIQVRPNKTFERPKEIATKNTLNLPDAPEVLIDEAPDTKNGLNFEKQNNLPEVVAKPEVKKITETPKESKKEEEKKDNRPTLDENLIRVGLQKISTNGMMPEAFAEYFCEDKNPLVIANGKSDTFQSFSKFIKGKKVIIKNITWGTGKKCIYSFDINYTR